MKTMGAVGIIQLLTSSKLNSTPPIGAPKATETPAAAEADNISLFLASFLPYLGNRYEKKLPTIFYFFNVYYQRFFQ